MEKNTDTPTPRERLRNYMKSKKPDTVYNDDDTDDTDLNDMLDYTSALDEKHTQMTQSNKRLAEAINRDPAVGAFLAAIVEGKSPSYAAARYLGRDFLEADPDSDEFAEIVKAEEERQADVERTRKQQQEFDTNLEKSETAFDNFARENGMDETAFEAFFKEVYAVLLNPIMAGNYTPEVLDRLKKAMDYDAAVADAEQVGRAAARNEKIITKRFGGDEATAMPSLAGKVRNSVDTPSGVNDLYIPRESVLDKGRRNKI